MRQKKPQGGLVDFLNNSQKPGNIKYDLILILKYVLYL